MKGGLWIRKDENLSEKKKSGAIYSVEFKSD
jgi:hypothetical protein